MTPAQFSRALSGTRMPPDRNHRAGCTYAQKQAQLYGHLTALKNSPLTHRREIMYTYRTDAVSCDTQYATADDAVAAAISDGEWSPIDSEQEAKYIADGAWMCVYRDGVPEIVRGQMP